MSAGIVKPAAGIVYIKRPGMVAVEIKAKPS
jgi:hypothetical protein